LYVVPRRRLVFAVWLTVLALPILVIDNIPRTDARAAVVTADVARAIETATTATTTPAPDFSVVPATIVEQATTSSRPATTTTRPRAKAAAPAPTSTTTTRPKTTTTTIPPNTETGGASWYDYRAGECAHKTIAKGTVVTVTNVATGASTTCVVTDRGPYGGGRIIDLDKGTFAQIGDPSPGVIQVRITWR
jgi:rare lipoprotein A (peptidoglycan hydrolase)